MFDSKVQKRFFKNVKSIKTKKKGVVSQNCIKTRQITASQELKKKYIFLSKKKVCIRLKVSFLHVNLAYKKRLNFGEY